MAAPRLPSGHLVGESPFVHDATLRGSAHPTKAYSPKRKAHSVKFASRGLHNPAPLVSQRTSPGLPAAAHRACSSGGGGKNALVGQRARIRRSRERRE